MWRIVAEERSSQCRAASVRGISGVVAILCGLWLSTFFMDASLSVMTSSGEDMYDPIWSAAVRQSSSTGYTALGAMLDASVSSMTCIFLFFQSCLGRRTIAPCATMVCGDSMRKMWSMAAHRYTNVSQFWPTIVGFQNFAPKFWVTILEYYRKGQ